MQHFHCRVLYDGVGFLELFEKMEDFSFGMTANQLASIVTGSVKKSHKRDSCYGNSLKNDTDWWTLDKSVNSEARRIV